MLKDLCKATPTAKEYKSSADVLQDEIQDHAEVIGVSVGVTGDLRF